MEVLLTRPRSEWRDLQGEATASEIAQQPQVWRELRDILAAREAEVHAFLGDFLAQRENLVILSGAGTSAYIGEGIAEHLNRQHACEIRAVPTPDLIASPDWYLERGRPTLLVSFARSGNSPESMAAVELVRQQVDTCRFLHITCNRNGSLRADAAGRGDTLCLLMPEKSCDRSFAMTSSYSTMMLAALAVFDGGAWQGKCERIDTLICAAERLIEYYSVPVAQLAKTQVDRIVCLGSGAYAALAREAALKMLELSAGKMVAVSDTSLGFRHGPKSVVNGRTLVCCFVSSDPHTRRYDLDMIGELQRDARAAFVLTIGEATTGDGFEPDIASPASGLTDAWLAPLWVIPAQLYALHRSIALGNTPDNPFPNGELNRVVQGVTIYPYHAR